VSGRAQTAVIIAAAGSGRRMGGDKLLMPLGGRPVLTHTIERCLAAAVSDLVLVAVRPGAEDAVRRQALVPYGLDGRVRLVAGGAHRAASVALALEAAAVAMGTTAGRRVLVHDGARPLATESLFRRVAASVEPGGGAAACLPVTDSLHRSREGHVHASVSRDGLWAAQTPQGFDLDVLREAHAWAAAARAGVRWSDDAGLVAGRGAPVRLVPGEATNLKLTVSDDLPVAEAVLAAMAGARERTVERRGAWEHRVGFGWDVHRLAPGLRLVLGGVPIPFERGSVAHSDGDVVAHALMDAILGAAGLRDIGVHFPPDDPSLAGADSLALLRRTWALAAAAGWHLANADATVVAEAPRLAPHARAMVSALAAALGVAEGRINIKAATSEGLGAVGAGQAIEAHAVVLLARPAGDGAGHLPDGGTPGL
jgi:2-C-methyl-D-erythritol 4-phosphate cytidylyltransferase/2-C-methyl-D-erythritol 2,4-cyclodiphosphate synthase